MLRGSTVLECVAVVHCETERLFSSCSPGTTASTIPCSRSATTPAERSSSADREHRFPLTGRFADMPRKIGSFERAAPPRVHGCHRPLNPRKKNNFSDASSKLGTDAIATRGTTFYLCVFCLAYARCTSVGCDS